MVNRAVTEVAGREIDIEFVVAAASQQQHAAASPVRVNEADLWQPEAKQNGRDQPSKPKRKPRPAGDGSLAVDIRTLNQTGYQPLTNYYPQFIAPYLRHKWANAGDRAFILWTRLVGDDGQRVTGAGFRNWSRPQTYQLETLAGLVGSSIQGLTGRYGYCDKFAGQKKVGAPLSRCCHPEGETEFRAGRHCRYWRPGVLEVLSAEGMLRVQEHGGRKNYRLTLQLWRSWPLLTPYQVSRWYPPPLQAEHQRWLRRWSAITGVTVEQWQGETAESAIEQFPDRARGLECTEPFIRNPFWRKGGL